jgi:hypothetical protein
MGIFAMFVRGDTSRGEGDAIESNGSLGTREILPGRDMGRLCVVVLSEEEEVVGSVPGRGSRGDSRGGPVRE